MMWLFFLLLMFVVSDPGGPGDVFYATAKAPGKPADPDYWWLGIAGEKIFAGPYVNVDQARAAALLHARGQLDDVWATDYQASPHGTGYWAWRRQGLSGPFTTQAAAHEWIEEQEGRV
jgi:hypothetical protein